MRRFKLRPDLPESHARQFRVLTRRRRHSVYDCRLFGTTPTVPINVIDYANNSDVVVAPYPNNVPIEGDAADCSGWPDTYQSDSHTNVLDRNTCWDYETYNTNRCNGLYDASEEAIWDMPNGNYRPWGWTSTDAAGLSVMAGLVKYDEAASGTIKHAIRYHHAAIKERCQ